MLAALVRFALTQRLFVLLVTTSIAIAGYYAFEHTPIDAFPDVSTPQVKIIVKAPGMTPEEVESRITAPIEVEMLGIPRQVMLRSVTKYSLADVTVDFAEGTDVYWARQQVAERLSGIWSELPGGVSGGMAPITTPLGEMFMFTVESSELSLMEKRALLDWVIRPALRTVPGVADVNSLGGEVRSFEIIPDADRMLARGISHDDLRSALEENNRNDGAGRLNEGEEALIVRTQGSVSNLEDLRAIVVKGHEHEPVRVADVAEVRFGSLTRYGAVTRNGEAEAVQGLVLGLRGANARQVAAGARAKLEEISPSLPPGVELLTFYDRSDLVERSVATVRNALLSAVVLVFLVLIAFLGNLRAALNVALVLPLALLLAMILIYQAGMTANLMSLGGLAIALGMLVDSAVVVVENIVSALAKPEARRLPHLHVVYRATREVALPVTSGTVIIALVFLPLLALEGLEGKLFAPVALTVVFALAGALILSLTIVPVLASIVLRSGAAEPGWVRRIEALYLPLLEASSRHARIVGAVAIVLLIVAGVLYTRVGKTFLPALDEGNVIVQIEKLPSIGLESSLDTDMRIESALIARVPEVTGVVARTGADEIGLDPMGLNQTDAFLILRPRDEWRFSTREGLLDAMREVLADYPSIAFGFTQPIEMRISEMLTGVRGDVAVKIFGPDLRQLNRTAEEIEAVVRSVAGAEDVFVTHAEGARYLQIEIDRLAVGRLGLSVDDVQRRLRAEIEGERVGTVFEGVRRTPVLLRGAESVRRSAPNFSNLRVALASGDSVPLVQLAKVSRVDGPVQINRERGNRMAAVLVNVRGRDLVGFVEELKARVGEKVRLAGGTRIAWGGQFENQQRAARRLALVVPAALTLIFVLLFTTFRSLRQAILVMANVPFALVGGIGALWLTGEYMSVPASIGLIALLGIAVLNGVVLVSHMNELRAGGMDLKDVVIQGARRRLRPVLMTASSTALGLAPLVVATGPGSELQRPLAIVVIGGLVSSTALTLILLPILYERFSEGR